MCFRLDKIGITCANTTQNLCVNTNQYPNKIVFRWHEVLDDWLFVPCKYALESGHQLSKKHLIVFGICVVQRPAVPNVDGAGGGVYNMYNCFYRKGIEHIGKKNIEHRVIDARSIRAEFLPELFPEVKLEEVFCNHCRIAAQKHDLETGRSEHQQR